MTAERDPIRPYRSISSNPTAHVCPTPTRALSRFDLIRSIAVTRDYPETPIHDPRFPMFDCVPLRAMIRLYRDDALFDYPSFLHTLFPELPLDSIPMHPTNDDHAAWCTLDINVAQSDLDFST